MSDFGQTGLLGKKEAIRSFVVFSFIGSVNTAIHFFTLLLLVEFVGLGAIHSNVIGFLGANIFSYFANSKWSFRVGASSVRYLRFLATSFIGVVASYGIASFAENLGLHYLFGFFMVIGVMPIINFALLKIFVFRQ